MKMMLDMPMTYVRVFNDEENGYKHFDIDSSNPHHPYYKPPHDVTITLCYDVNTDKWPARYIAEDWVLRYLTDAELKECIEFLKEKKLID